ncbi:hypothetical protein MMC07_001528 [Pseudocyphellaria aurata]|nr:hypothetical protein [Pseudocyphellaria aurata]
MAGWSDSLYADSPFSTSSLGQSTLSRDRSGFLDGPNMYSSEPGTVASDDMLLQPYQTQARHTFSAASSSEPAMSHAMSGHPGQFASNVQPDSRFQANRPGDANHNLSVTLTDDGGSNSMNVEALQVHPTSQGRSHENDRIQWSCTLCEHDNFRGKQEWIRHERNQHFPRHVYYCHPDIEVRNKELYCMACKVLNPGCTHIARRDAHVCAWKNLSARLFVSKEKFIKHLRSHDLHSECRQLDEWKRPLPEQVWGCGFCVKVFDDVEERLFHMTRHFERGKTRADWDPSRVLLSLLTLPYIANEWVLRVNVELRVEHYGHVWPELSWSKEDAVALQRRVTSGQENGADLAESAFNMSLIGREIQRRKQQFAFGFKSLASLDRGSGPERSEGP